MNDKLKPLDQVERLKRKLESAVSSRAILESDFKTQTSLLIQFIGKLSQVCKGIDLELDNKLANLRSMLNKSAPLSEIEHQIGVISQLLQQHSKVNEVNLHQLHQELTHAGTALQKTNGLPPTLRRELRAFLSECEESKDAIVQYVPLLRTLIEFYDTALKAKTDIPKGGLLASINNKQTATTEVEDNTAELKPIIDKLIALISQLELSNGYDKQLSEIKLKLDSDMPVDFLLENFTHVFNLIIAEFRQERKTARTFLSTLSDTLSTVQNAVSNTISVSNKSKATHAKLNSQLDKQIKEMTEVVDKATSLAKIKVDINGKLHAIVNTIELKSAFEKQQQKEIETQLASMKDKVNELEQQGETFKKRIEDQKLKSLQDALTKLNNRAAFDDYFAQQIVRFHHTPFELAIVVVDLDNFKRINDTYGHTAGDKTLQVIANTLTKQIGDEGFIARYGGEEFVLVFSGLNKKQLMTKLNKLKTHISRLPFKFKNNKVSITTSVGATHIKESDNVHISFERADQALYQAKADGKNQVIYIE
ncbi:diguanylate cyclase [Thalassotalea sp. PLHSN55]|uniref:GGDEF domain-containing protein n=1 Tax=Thalassotalea sp. PLHSN55 TaxID=3435888 RepID=UPI003F829E53